MNSCWYIVKWSCAMVCLRWCLFVRVFNLWMRRSFAVNRRLMMYSWL